MSDCIIIVESLRIMSEVLRDNIWIWQCNYKSPVDNL